MNLRRMASASALAALAVAGLSAAPPAAAQDPLLNDLTSWHTLANGDEVVSAAVNPVDGRLWVGTEGGGLVVWNTASRTFDQYLFPNQPGLLTNTVYDIGFNPSNGDAWLATDMGVTRVEHATMNFRTYVADTVEARPEHSVDRVDVVDVDDFPDSRVFNAVAVADDGSVWVGTPDRGVATLGLDGRWTHYLYSESDLELGPQREQVTDIATLPDGTVWVAHGRTNVEPFVSVFDPATGLWSGIASSGPSGDVANGPRTTQVMALDVQRLDGNDFYVWCATWNHGVYRWESSTKAWTEYNDRDTQVPGDPDSGLCDDTVWSIAERDGIVWAACSATSGDSGRGVSRLDTVTGLWRRFNMGDGLPTDIVTAIALGDGVAYLGTDEPRQQTRGSHGIVPLQVDGSGPHVLPALQTAGSTPFVNEVSALAWDDAGSLWIGTRQSGVMRYEPGAGAWTHYTQASTGERLAGDAVTAIAMNGDEVWVSSAHERIRDGKWIDGGVSVYDRGAGAWTRTLRVDETTMASSQVGSVAIDGNGQAWAGYGVGNNVPTGSVSSDVQQGRGIDVLDGASGQVTASHTYDNTGGRLAGDTVLALSARGAEVWAATSYFGDAQSNRVGGGMSRWDGASWEVWRNGDAGLTTYADGQITGDMRSVLAEPNGAVWAGTFTGDANDVVTFWPLVTAVINRFDPADQTWASAQFASQGWISAIARDGSDQVWLGTTRGHMQELWRGDGVLGEEIDNPKIRDLADGGLHVGAADMQGQWVNLTPQNSGVGAKGITALAVDPSTGFVWVGTESGGLSIYTHGDPMGPPPTPRPSPTPCPSGINCPTVTPTPSRTQTLTPAPIRTAPPPGPGTALATAIGLGRNDGSSDEPEPPPEVPEASTWLLLVTGAIAIGGYAWWRQRHAATPGR